MKATLIIEGKEIEIEISEEEYKKLQPPKEKKTGYERVPDPNGYFYVNAKGEVEYGVDLYDYIDDKYYNSANYYSSKDIAENNARADKLVRQLRRFAVEHNECGVNFNDTNAKKYYICYDYENNELNVSFVFRSRKFGVIYFDLGETANAAIDEFRDELIWYFTEYKEGL